MDSFISAAQKINITINYVYINFYVYVCIIIKTNDMRNEQLLEQLDEYENRLYKFIVEIKNNTGLNTIFIGSQKAFDKMYLHHDTYGKVVDYSKSEVTPKDLDSNICEDRYSPYYGQSLLVANAKRNTWGEEVDGLNRSNTNKRYHKHL